MESNQEIPSENMRGISGKQVEKRPEAVIISEKSITPLKPIAKWKLESKGYEILKNLIVGNKNFMLDTEPYKPLEEQQNLGNSSK